MPKPFPQFVAHVPPFRAVLLHALFSSPSEFRRGKWYDEISMAFMMKISLSI